MVHTRYVPFFMDHIDMVHYLMDHSSTYHGFMDMYHIRQLPKGYETLCKKVKDYADYEFNYEKRIQQWDNLIEHTIQSWKSRYNRYNMETL